MKLPELRPYEDLGMVGIYGDKIDSLTRADALEVISRCNAAPKLVEALEWCVNVGHGNGRAGGEVEPMEFEACMDYAQAILKETGAEK